MRRWLVTGGLGFIGSAFVRLLLRSRPDVDVVNLDSVTYAANPANLDSVLPDARYRFVRGDICDGDLVERLVATGFHAIVNFAAETHVDRSILSPTQFLRTDIIGTHVLLDAARRSGIERFLQISTDEVYGDVPEGASHEASPLAPRSPYAASKAGADLQVLAYATTFGLKTLVTRGCNTYGPYQYPEKLVPLFTTNLIDGEPVPIYGDGLQRRDWIHVDDHAAGILHVLEHGTPGEIYNLGASNERTNLELTRLILTWCGRSESTHVTHVLDRAGHDRRYCLDSTKAHALGWRAARRFEDGLEETVRWYRANEAWWRPLRDGSFRAYYERQYAQRRSG